MGSDKKNMLAVLGVTDFNLQKNYFQQALELYPELLRDIYSKNVLKEVKKKTVSNAKEGKIKIDGYYTFICPDLYAFCEHLILKIKKPKGLLQNNEVYCSLFKEEELDCLRSPHLYKEHAIRINVHNQEIKRWFITKNLYTSVHDPISKILMFDVDGDKGIVCNDKTLVEVAKRNMDGVVPLYYNMKKADPELITKDSIYNGLKLAYTGGNIGAISNNISKVWNSSDIDLDVIKILCMESNFTIDYAKTLYKPKRPNKEIAKRISKYANKKVPHFFIYAKNKKENEVEPLEVDPLNDSVVNKLEKMIPKTRIKFNAANIGHFDYTVLMSRNELDSNREELKEAVIKKYNQLNQNKRFSDFVPIDKESSGDNIHEYKLIRNKILEVTDDITFVVDVLVHYLYVTKNTKHKVTLWSSFGDVVVQNIKNNLETGTMFCELCGSRTKITGRRMKYCEDCRERMKRQKANERAKRFRAKNT
jgi:hypothetical protein